MEDIGFVIFVIVFVGPVAMFPLLLFWSMVREARGDVDMSGYEPVSWLPRWFFRRLREAQYRWEMKNQGRAWRKAKAKVEAERYAEEFGAWCPQLAKAVQRRGIKIEPCEHLKTDLLVEVANMYASIEDDYRRQMRLQEFVDRNYLPGNRWSTTCFSEDDDDDRHDMSKKQRDHLWYDGHSELNWRDRERGQAWGMDAATYVSNWLESD